VKWYVEYITINIGHPIRKTRNKSFNYALAKREVVYNAIKIINEL